MVARDFQGCGIGPAQVAGIYPVYLKTFEPVGQTPGLPQAFQREIGVFVPLNAVLAVQRGFRVTNNNKASQRVIASEAISNTVILNERSE